MLRPTRTHGFKILFAVLLQALALAATYTDLPWVFSGSDLRGIIMLGLVVNAVLLLGSLFFLPVVANALLSTIVLTGVAITHIVHTDLYFMENRLPLIIVCSIAYFALFVIFQAIDDLLWTGPTLSASVLLGLSFLIGWHFLFWKIKAPINVDQTKIRAISFQETPNLYFISFDSAIPKPLLKKHLGEESTEFHDLYGKHFRRFPNFFSGWEDTVKSFNLLLSLDEEIFFQYYWQAYPRNIRLFSGQHPAPLFHLLRSNGYEINTLYYNGYLGKRKGAYIDNYVTIEKTTICDTLSPKIRSFSFWGYCWLTGRTINHDHLIANAHQRLIESIINIDSTQPQFVLAHIQLPNHTTRSFRHNKVQDIAKFSALYRQASDHAARYLKQIIEHLQHDDPTAILFVFGDHGPHLSRGMQIADDPTFFLQDRYGILGGIYPRTT